MFFCPGSADADPATDRPEHRVYGDWTASRIGGGGFILGVKTTSDPERLYAWTDVGGAHRSDDGGQTWRNMTYNLPYGGNTESRGMMYVRDLLTDPVDPDRVMIAIGYHWSPTYGVFVSDDAGRTWANTLDDLWVVGDDETRMDGAVLARDPSNPETIWAVGIGQGLFVSKDNGQGWDAVGGPEVQPTDLLIDRSDSDRIWVAGHAMDRGVREDKANRPDGQLVLPGGLWRSDDGGATWDAVIEDRSVRNVKQDPVDADTLYAIVDDHRWVLRSTDGGETWNKFGDGLDIGSPSHWGPHPHRYQDLVVAHGQVYALSSRGHVYRLDRDAERWTKFTGPDRAIDPEGWWGATPDDPTFGTSNWVTTMSSAARLTVDPRDPDTMWMTDWYSVYRTDDAGQTWRNTTEGIEVTYIDALEQDPSDPNVVHLGMADNGYFRSDDRGVNFQGFSNDTAITNNVKSISVPAGNPNRVYAVGPNPPGGGWYAGQVFISDDKGDTWRVSPMSGLPEIDERGHRALTIVAVDDRPDTVFLTVTQPIERGGGGLYVSQDAGQTWTSYSDGLPSGVAFYRNEAWRGGKELAIGPDHVMLTQSIANHLLYRRGAEAKAWEKLDFPFVGELNDLRADPHCKGRFFAAAMNDGVYRTDDHGDTWTRLDTPSSAPGATQLLVDRVVPDRIAAGTSNGVILSRDGGASWQHLDASLPGRVDWNKGAFAGDRLVVGSGGTGAYWIDVAEDQP
ncbi:MAG: hypothetical protein AAF916_09020 [Planctomycetota bacterium]